MTKNTSRLSSELDYNIESTNERVDKVSEIVNKNEDKLLQQRESYNPHINKSGQLSENDPASKDLERLADYLLHADEQERKKKDSNEGDLDHPIMTNHAKKRNIQREATTDKLGEVGQEKPVTATKKYPKIKVSKSDREDYSELEQTGEYISSLKQMIATGFDTAGKPISNEDIKKLKWIVTEVHKDEIVMKDHLKRYIRFVRLSPENPNKDLENFNFQDVEQVKAVFDNYSSLVEDSYEDTAGDVRPIIQVFEELEEATEFKPFMKDIFIYKIDGMSRKDISIKVEEDHDLSLSEERISQITQQVIPKMLVDTYKRLKEDWLYLNVIKGDYKTCAKCGETKLTKHFGKYSRSKDGLRSECKKCR